MRRREEKKRTKAGKRLLSLLLCGAMTISGIFGGGMSLLEAEETTEPSGQVQTQDMSYRLGDVNCDGVLNLQDTQLTLRAALAIVTLEEFPRVLADVNKDSTINLQDAQIVLRAALGIITLDEFVDGAEFLVKELTLVVNGENGYGSILTQEEQLSLEGKILGEEAAASLICSRAEESGATVEKEVPISGKNWSTEAISLSEGANPIKLTLTGQDGTVVEKDLVIYRSSKEIKVKDDVIALDVEDEEQLAQVKEISEGLVAYHVLDMGTEDLSDDECELIVEEDSPLVRYVKEGKIQPGEVLYVPANEYVTAGLTFRYRERDDVSKSGETYDPDRYEVLHGVLPSFAELLDGSGCLAMDALSQEDPIAFVYGPSGMELGADGTEELPRYLADGLEMEFQYGNDNSVEEGRKGFQFQNIKKFKFSAQAGHMGPKSIKLSYDKVILYDEDGKKNTKKDRIVLDGSFEIANINPVFGCEWGEGSKTPLQMVSTLEYNENVGLKATFGGELKNADKLTSGNPFEETRLDEDKAAMTLWGGVKATGVDLSKSVVVGAIGLRLGGTQMGTMRSIQDTSVKMKLNPLLVILLYVDMEGNLETTASISYNYGSYVKKGVNVQKKGYVGAFGTCEQNNNGCINEVVDDYQVNVYNTIAKSKRNLKEKPEKVVTLNAFGKASASAGIGVGAGVMMAGIIPAYARAGLQFDAELIVNGSLSFHHPYKDDFGADGTPSFLDAVKTDGEFKFVAGTHTLAEASVRLAISRDEGIIRFESEFGKTFQAPELTLAGWKFSSAKVQGAVKDRKTEEPISGAVVKLTPKKPNYNGKKIDYQTVTDENGRYELPHCLEGDYVLTVEREGYVSAEEDYEIKVEPGKLRKDKDVFLQKILIKDGFYVAGEKNVWRLVVKNQPDGQVEIAMGYFAMHEHSSKPTLITFQDGVAEFTYKQTWGKGEWPGKIRVEDGKVYVFGDGVAGPNREREYTWINDDPNLYQRY